MKKFMCIAALALLAACGGNTQQENRSTAQDEEVDIGAGEEISPQLELDSSESRFEVDTVNSTESVEKESAPDDESF